jgi:choline dehydrogenase-like flavoprotein
MTIRPLDEVAGAALAPAVLVVGSGPAGITVARELAAAGVACVVAESGDRLPSAAAMDLDRGRSVGLPLRFEDVDVGTAGMRMRTFGGTSAHWTGQCHPLGEIDLAARRWRPGSGWPIGPADLEPWYRRAEATLALRPGAWDPAGWHDLAGTEAPLAGGALDAVAFQFSPPVRFADAFGPELEDSGLVDVLLDATATELRTTPDGAAVDRVVLRSRTGVEVEVRPDVVVLATGALEVPRVLLASRTRDPAGVANGSGLVGVGFMEHPHRWAGRAHLVDDPAWSLYGLRPPPDGQAPPSHVWLGWQPSPEVQEAEELANAAVLLWPGGGRGAAAEPPSPEAVAAGLLLGAMQGGTTFEASLSLRCEQLPLETSTVRLGSEVDALGVPRLVVDWQVDPGVERTQRRVLELLAAELGRAGLGRLEVDPGGRPLDELPIEIGNHPMGTARMGDDPAAGVVDGQLRAHGVANLYVAGSAVFPTGGHANPTLTIVALAHRLGAQLAAELA